MKTYQDHGGSVQDDEGRWIPKDPGNRDYSTVLAEIAKGEAALVMPAPVAIVEASPAAAASSLQDEVIADLCRALPAKDRTAAMANFIKPKGT
jgi:hypothetical protein